MSEMSLLWHEYQRFNELARDITDDVILLQRVRLQLPGFEDVTAAQLAASRVRVAQFLDALTASLCPHETADDSEGMRIPGTLVERIRTANSGSMPRFVSELEVLREDLTSADGRLSDRDMSLLDGLTSSVSQETSRVFSRLLRK
jgi:hypothetical protein